MKNNWLKSNIGLFAIIPVILELILRIIPESDLSWFLYLFVYLPSLPILIVTTTIAIVFYKKQSLISKIFLAIGILYLLYLLSTFYLPLSSGPLSIENRT